VVEIVGVYEISVTGAEAIGGQAWPPYVPGKSLLRKVIWELKIAATRFAPLMKTRHYYYYYYYYYYNQV
jgi:hypothetical protein